MEETTKKVILVTNKLIELEVEGKNCEEDAKAFISMHAEKVDESPYEFLFFARDWFKNRGYKVEVRPMSNVGVLRKMLIRILLAVEKRRI